MNPMINRVFFGALTAFVMSCGASMGPAGPAAPTPPTVRLETTTVPVTVELADGPVRVRVMGGDWQAVSGGTLPAATTHVRVEGDAAFALGTARRPSGRLWLRAGTTAVLSSRPSVDLIVAIDGRARISGFEPGLTVATEAASGLVDLTERDVLVEAGRVVDTGADLAGAAWTLGIGQADEPGGIGALETDRASLELRKLSVTATTVNGVAETTIEHVFFNASDEQLEGTFRFPLPAGAIVTGLAMEIGGALMEGELVEREKARETYQSIVDSMRDPALLEWDGGSSFKLRVFPIEPRSEKRIVLRCLLPITTGALGPRLTYATAAPALETRIGHFRFEVDGRVVLDRADFAPGRALIAPVRTATGAAVEIRGDSTWTVATLSPSVPAGNGRRVRRDVVVVVDTSRSTLESRPRQAEAIRGILGELRSSDRFVLTAADITARDHAADFVEATPEAIEEALAFLSGIAPDGASDVLGAMRHAGRLADRAGLVAVQVVYVGDGTPSWGEVDPAAVRAGATAALGDTPLHAVVLGKSTDERLLRAIAGETGGKVVAPRTESEVRSFGLFLAHAAGAPRLRNARVTAGEGAEVHPRTPTTLFAGDEITALVRSETPPESLSLTGTLDGKPFERTTAVGEPRRGRAIAARWGAAEIDWQTDMGAEREVIVALSLKTQVMSRFSSFLVLESEEAYKRHEIERTRGPEVSGKDLESVAGADEASLHPDHIQPGDPEIRVPAPREARSVVVVFPFGESMPAQWDDTIGAWTVRFLVDKDTEDGEYPVIVRITHADGTPELLELSYTVDTQAPKVSVELIANGRQITIRATTEDPDVARVEVRTPEGRVVRLRRKARGLFVGTWKPRTVVAGPVALRIVAVDRPGNTTVIETELEVVR